MLHAYECAPGSGFFPLPVCESWGCATVSPALLTLLKTYIDGSVKPMLLWIHIIKIKPNYICWPTYFFNFTLAEHNFIYMCSL